jgi:hypothetical protein
MELKMTVTEAEKILLDWAQVKFGDMFNKVEIRCYNYDVKFTKEDTQNAAQ